MSLVGLVSMKGAPGVTTTAIALAGVLAGHADTLLVEADPAGGDLLARHGLRPDPGLVGLATAVQRRGGRVDPRTHAQVLPGGLHVVVAPPSGPHTRAALRSAEDLHVALAGPAATVIDCGRLDEDSPAQSLIMACDVVVIVSWRSLAALQHLRAGLTLLDRDGIMTIVALRGPGTYGDDEISEALGLPVVADLPDDPAAAALLNGRAARAAKRTLRASPLLRAVRALDTSITDLLNAPIPTTGAGTEHPGAAPTHREATA